MNEWIELINYASTFRSAGVRMRTSYMHDLRGSTARNSISSVPASVSSPSSQNFDRNSVTLSADSSGESANQCSSPTMEALSLPFAPNRTGNTSQSSTPTTPFSPMSPDLENVSGFFNPSRSLILQKKLQELNDRIITIDQQLQSDLRIARNFALLTPFHRSTRDRIQSCVVTLGKRVQVLRLELAKLRCHHYVLTCDLKSAERERDITSRSSSSRKDGRMRSVTITSPGRRASYSSISREKNVSSPSLPLKGSTSSATASFRGVAEGTDRETSGSGHSSFNTQT